MRFTIGYHHAQAFFLFLSVRLVLLVRQFRVRLRILNKPTRCIDILLTKHQNAVGVLAVATRAPRLLIIALQILRHIIMDDVSHIRLIDPHSEGIGRVHDPLAVIDKIVLILPAFLILQPGMVSRGGEAFITKGFADLFHSFACRAINDARLPCSLSHQSKQLLRLTARPNHREKQIWSVKTGRHLSGHI